MPETQEAAAPLITPEMQAEIGVEGATTTLEVDKTMVRLFARATGHVDPVYYDEDAAKAAGYRSLPCPPGYLGTPLYNPTGPRRDPTAQSGAQPSRPLKRILNGGTEIEYFSDICAGDVLKSATHVADLEETKGSIGDMLIVTSKTVYKRASDDKVVAISTGKLIRY
jgi:hypothetical protein